ncbi:MAG: DUF1015 domain-containing protein [Eubacterium sp.]|nr:DUF1015 domain-containing protein [Eubacterium sp.]
MAVFRGFKAFRPSADKQALIPALPYDVMNSDEAREMVKGNPYSFLHVDKAEIDLPSGTDIYDDSVYEKAKENLLCLEDSGALVQDKSNCFYIYRQVMNGRAQTGIAGCASIDDYMNNVIKKHEHTLAKKEVDRIRHVDTCDANTGPIFLTYRKNNHINDIVNAWIRNHEPVYNFTSDGVLQTVWVVDDSEAVAELSSLFETVPFMYIADGHHRCASAVKVGQMRREAKADYTGEEEFNFFLAVAFPDEELEIMDYNRVVRDLNGLSVDEFISVLSDKFIVTKQSERYKPAKKHTFGMLIKNQWYSLEAKDKIINDVDPIERLDVSMLQENILSPILNITDPKNDDRIDFIGGIRGLSELEKRTSTDMELAFAMYPTTVEDLMAIADADLIMPPKSTWFEPKLLSGLFIHHLTD